MASLVQFNEHKLLAQVVVKAQSQSQLAVAQLLTDWRHLCGAGVTHGNGQKITLKNALPWMPSRFPSRCALIVISCPIFTARALHGLSVHQIKFQHQYQNHYSNLLQRHCYQFYQKFVNYFLF